MNWLELDKVRSGHTTRLRRRPPDPRIGDHLPPPTQRSAEVPAEGSPSSSSAGGHPASNSGQLVPGQLGTSQAGGFQSGSGGSTFAVGGVDARGPPNGSPSVTPPLMGRADASPTSFASAGPSSMLGIPPMTQAPMYNANLNVTRAGNGRLSSVITEMMSMTSDHQGRVSSLKGAATEASYAQGDSLDQLLQEFAGVQKPLPRVGGAMGVGGLGVAAGGMPPYRQSEAGPSVHSNYSQPSQGAHGTPPMGRYQPGGKDFAGTMVHTTEVVLGPRATAFPSGYERDAGRKRESSGGLLGRYAGLHTNAPTPSPNGGNLNDGRASTSFGEPLE